jgi:hypothetical protein
MEQGSLPSETLKGGSLGKGGLGKVIKGRRGGGQSLGTGDVAEHLAVNAFDDFRRDNPIRIFFEIIGS